MSTAPARKSTYFRDSLIVAAVVGAVGLAVYLWALFTAQITLLNALGIASFALLLLCPAFVAYQAVRLTLQMGIGVSVRDYVRTSVRRSASLLCMDALVAVPLVVVFSLYLQIAITGIFIGAEPCEGACPPQIIHPELFPLQAVTVLVVAIGLWGLNLFATILGAWLALHWQRATPALSGTIVALIVTIAVIYALLNLTNIPQLAVDIVVTLLPFLLTFIAWRVLSWRID